MEGGLRGRGAGCESRQWEEGSGTMRTSRKMRASFHPNIKIAPKTPLTASTPRAQILVSKTILQ